MYKIGDKIRIKEVGELLKFYMDKGIYSAYSVIPEHGTFSVDGYVFSNSMYRFCGQEFTVGRIREGEMIYTKEQPYMYLIADWCEKPIDIIIDTERVNALI